MIGLLIERLSEDCPGFKVLEFDGIISSVCDPPRSNGRV